MAEMRLHAVEPRSRANGPGVRFALWVQGCSLGCAGCFNPDTHAGGGGRWAVDRLVAAIAAEGDAIEGVTVSGGEPFEQPDGLLALVSALRARNAGLSILVFSGYERAEIEAMPLGPAVLAQIDVLIDRRYRAPERLGRGLRGSANQRVHLLSDRYRAEEIEATPEAEIVIGPDGLVRMSGVRPVKVAAGAPRAARRPATGPGSGSDL